MTRIEVSLYVESRRHSVLTMNELIGVECDKYWEIGDPRGATGKTFETNSWTLTELSEAQDNSEAVAYCLHSLIRRLILRLKGHKRHFSAVARNNTSGLLVGITAPIIPPICLSSIVLRQVAILGVSIEIDIILSD
jgi:hypothetical protein